MSAEDDSRPGATGKPCRRKRPKPVKGQVIRISLRVAMLCILGLALFGLGSGVIFVLFLRDAYAHFVENGPPLEDPLVRLLCGAGVVGAPLLSARQIRKVRRQRRIVIGADRVQIVEGQGEDATVLVSLPYDNIADLKCKEVGFCAQLEVAVHDTEDPDTYFAGVDLEENYRTLGHHYEIEEGYEEPKEEIERLIRRAWKKHRPPGDAGVELAKIEAAPGNSQPRPAGLIRDESDAEHRPQGRRGKRPEPVEGEVIRTIYPAARFLKQCGILGIAVGVLLVVVGCAGLFDPAAVAIPPFVPLLGGVGFIGVSAPALAALRWWTRTGRRIVIGYDCVQVLDERDGEVMRVAASLPFDNIEAVKLTRIDFGFRLDFELIDLRDAGTYLPGVDVEANYRTAEFHYAITGRFEEPLSGVELLVRRALKRWRKKHRDAEDENA